MKLIWLDLETTGLNPETDAILEVAAFEATLEKPFDVCKIYDTVLEFHRLARRHVPPDSCGRCTRRTGSGTRVRCPASRSRAPSWISCAGSPPRRTRMTTRWCSPARRVHFDHSFIRAHMPELNARFQHRHYDVSAVSMFARSLGMPRLPKTEAHRAAQDCPESIAQAKAVAEWFRGAA